MEQLFQSLINKCINQHVTDLHVSRHDHKWWVQMRIKGDLKMLSEWSKDQGDRLVNYIKFISHLDLSMHFKPQTGMVRYDYQAKTLFLRVSSIPSTPHESLVIRVLNNHEPLMLHDLTCFKEAIDYFKQIALKKQGLMITSGATGSGKTTTLYALLQTIYEKRKVNIITVEDPIEIPCKNYTQLQINEEAGIDFYNCLKQILRHDPDVIMIGEIRDELTAKIAIRSALTGHLVLASMHASSPTSSINRLLELGVQLEDLKATLIGVSNQILCYTKKTKRPMCVYDWMTRHQLEAYFDHHEVPVNSMSMYLLQAVKSNVLTYESVVGYLHE